MFSWTYTFGWVRTLITGDKLVTGHVSVCAMIGGKVSLGKWVKDVLSRDPLFSYIIQFFQRVLDCPLEFLFRDDLSAQTIFCVRKAIFISDVKGELSGLIRARPVPKKTYNTNHQSPINIHKVRKLKGFVRKKNDPRNTLYADE